MPALRAIVQASPLLAIVCGICSCTSPEEAKTTHREGSGSEPPGQEISFSFQESASEAGLVFRHSSGADDSYPMPAILGGGGALFDSDGDGDLDVFLVNGHGGDNRLFANRGDGTFEDVTPGSGLDGLADTEGAHYGMGAAIGDIDNDGDLDLYITYRGPNHLYRNDGSGRFHDITSEAGVEGDGWSASATFVDYDRDGLLDLYVTRYVDWDPDRVCALEGGQRDFCGPAQFDGLSDLLFHNLGEGRFEDRSRSAGIAARADRGLGVAYADFDDDGWPDLYVANDSDPNHLWMNQRDGTFREEGLLLGAAYNRYGVGEAGMGVTLGDTDGDGDLDLFISHLFEETNTFYENRGVEGFEDRTAQLGLGVPSLPYTGFGTALFDADNDGDLDLAVANGAIKRRPETLVEPGGPLAAYAEPNQLYENGGSSFVEVRASGVEAPIEISRGLLPADLDGDGDLDLVVTNVEGPVRYYRNKSSRGGAITVRLIDPALRRAADGACLTVHLGESERTFWALPPFGYLTSGEALVHVGLGQADGVEAFDVRWPDHSLERFAGALAGTSVELVKGSGETP